MQRYSFFIKSTIQTKLKGEAGGFQPLALNRYDDRATARTAHNGRCLSMESGKLRAVERDMGGGVSGVGGQKDGRAFYAEGKEIVCVRNRIPLTVQDIHADIGQVFSGEIYFSCQFGGLPGRDHPVPGPLGAVAIGHHFQNAGFVDHVVPHYPVALLGFPAPSSMPGAPTAPRPSSRSSMSPQPA